MITVNFTGGAKKWFNIAQLIIEKNDLTIKQLLKHLIEIKPNNTIDFDEKNLLIAVNGIVARKMTNSKAINRRMKLGLSGSIGVLHPFTVLHLERISVFQEAPIIPPYARIVGDMKISSA